MRRYNVPRIAFINKLDRMGANPQRVLDLIKTKLRLNAAAIQVSDGVRLMIPSVASQKHIVGGSSIMGVPGSIAQPPDDLIHTLFQCCCPQQLPIGLESAHVGVVCLVTMKVNPLHHSHTNK